MRLVTQIISWVALAVTLLPAFLFLNGTMDLHQVKNWMLIATIVWFVAVPCWMGRKAA